MKPLQDNQDVSKRSFNKQCMQSINPGKKLTGVKGGEHQRCKHPVAVIHAGVDAGPDDYRHMRARAPKWVSAWVSAPALQKSSQGVQGGKGPTPCGIIRIFEQQRGHPDALEDLMQVLQSLPTTTGIAFFQLFCSLDMRYICSMYTVHAYSPIRPVQDVEGQLLVMGVQPRQYGHLQDEKAAKSTQSTKQVSMRDL